MQPPYYAELLIVCGEFSYWFCLWSLLAIAAWVRTLFENGAVCPRLRHRLGVMTANFLRLSQLGRFPTGFG